MSEAVPLAVCVEVAVGVAVVRGVAVAVGEPVAVGVPAAVAVGVPLGVGVCVVGRGGGWPATRPVGGGTTAATGHFRPSHTQGRGSVTPDAQAKWLKIKFSIRCLSCSVMRQVFPSLVSDVVSCGSFSARRSNPNCLAGDGLIPRPPAKSQEWPQMLPRCPRRSQR